MPSKPEYLKFVEVKSPSKKTRVVEIRSVHSNRVLGRIAWFSAWRQYAFYPGTNTLFNPECLEQISARVQGMTNEHRENLRRLREAQEELDNYPRVN